MDAACFYCSKNGHWYRNCPERQPGKQQQGKRATSYGGYGACYVCKETGHWAPQCPKRESREKKEEEKTGESKTYGIKRPNEYNHKCLNCGFMGHGVFECTADTEYVANYEDLSRRLFDNNLNEPRGNYRNCRYWYWCGEVFEMCRRGKEKETEEECQITKVSYKPDFYV